MTNGIAKILKRILLFALFLCCHDDICELQKYVKGVVIILPFVCSVLCGATIKAYNNESFACFEEERNSLKNKWKENVQALPDSEKEENCNYDIVLINLYIGFLMENSPYFFRNFESYAQRWELSAESGFVKGGENLTYKKIKEIRDEMLGDNSLIPQKGYEIPSMLLITTLGLGLFVTTETREVCYKYFNFKK